MNALALVLLVAGMGLVTFLPRMLPMVVLKEMKLPASLRRFLEFIPYTVLGALIFPGILSSAGEGNADAALAGAIAAAVLAFFGLNVIFVVLGGILGVFCWQTFF